MGNRTRSRGGFSNITGSGYWRNSSGGHAENYYYGSIGCVESISDVVTPGFHKLKDKGAIFNNACSIYKNEIRQSGIDCTWATTNWDEGWINLPIQVVTSKPAPPYLSDSLSLAAAVNQANAGVAPADAMVAVTIAELSKTISTFKNLGGTVRQFVNGAYVALRVIRGKSNSRRVQRQAAQDLADSWLAFRYGVMPTIYDLQGCVKAVNRKYEVRETSRGRVEITDQYTVPIYISWRGPITGTWLVKRSTTYRAGVLYSPSSEPTIQMMTSLGLSAADALTVPWELVPFSFVLDWAIDVGDWLRAVAPKPGVKGLASWTVADQKIEVSTSGVTATVTEPNWTGGGGGGSYYELVHLKERTPSATPTIPGYGNGLNLNRSIDSAMLSMRQLSNIAGIIDRAISSRHTYTG